MGAVYEASAAPQHCNSPVCQVGTNKSPVPRPSAPTGDPGEGEAQVAPPGSLMHCEPCALQSPGAGLPGEAAPLVVRGGGGAFEALGAGQAAEGQAGGRPAHLQAKETGLRKKLTLTLKVGVSGCCRVPPQGAPAEKRVATLPEVTFFTPTPSWGRTEPSPQPWELVTKERFLQPQREPIAQPKRTCPGFSRRVQPSSAAMWATGWGPRLPSDCFLCLRTPPSRFSCDHVKTGEKK